MTKNDFKKMVPDVCCQELLVTTDNVATLCNKALGVSEMLGTGLIAYDYTATRSGYKLKVFTSYAFKSFLAALKPGVTVRNSRGREFAITSEPFVENCQMCVRTISGTWFCDSVYNKDYNYEQS